MSIISSIFGRRQPSSPPKIATDSIIPIHDDDDTAQHRGNLMNLFFRFDDALDVEKLEQSLYELLDRPGWNKLGGRLRLNVKGTIDLHIPASFDEKRPSATFYHEQHAICIAEHPLASRLPIAMAGKPQIVENTADFLALMRRPEDPKILQDYLNSDRPALGIHVVTFTDATLVTMQISHLVTDLVGIGTFFNGWQLVLQGRTSELPPLEGIEKAPMEKLGDDQKMPYAHTNKLFGTSKLVLLGLRLVWDKLWHCMSQEEELRLICVPGPYIKSLRADALKILAAHESADGKAPFVSEGDVLLAWWTQTLIPYISTSSRQTVAVINVLEIRSLLVSKGLLSAGSEYIGNAFAWVPVFTTVNNIVKSSISDLASAIRQSLVTLSKSEQVEAFMALQHATGKEKFVLGDVGMKMMVCTNGTKVGLYDLDFSAALVREGSHKGGQKVGRPSLFHCHCIEPPGNSLMKILYITGKDANGNYWMFTTLRPKIWTQVQRTIT